MRKQVDGVTMAQAWDKLIHEKLWYVDNGRYRNLVTIKIVGN